MYVFCVYMCVYTHTYICMCIYIYIYLLYVNLMETTKQKEYKHNTKDSHQTMRADSKRSKEQRETTKIARKIVNIVSS